MADAFFRVSLDFMIRHDLAHIMNGHILLVKERKYGMTVDDIRPSAGPHFRQTLEMDADAVTVCDFLMDDLKALQRPCDHKREHEIGTRIQLKLSAIYCALRLYGFGKNEKDKVSPSPASRRNMIAGTACTYFLHHLGEDRMDRLVPFIAGAGPLSEEAFAAISGLTIPKPELRSSLAPEAFQWELAIAHQWNELYPDLFRLAFSDRLIGPPR
jgi:hypothetical protein